MNNPHKLEGCPGIELLVKIEHFSQNGHCDIQNIAHIFCVNCEVFWQQPFSDGFPVPVTSPTDGSI